MGMEKLECEFTLFQSLFFWMTPIKDALLGDHERDQPVSILVLLDDSHQGSWWWSCRMAWRVSILVLLDDSHQAGAQHGGLFGLGLFQSLFFWMTPIKLVPSMVVSSALVCFNPCSSG